LTVTTSKEKYDKCKSETFAAIKYFRILTFHFLAVTMVLLGVLVADIFLKTGQ